MLKLVRYLSGYGRECVLAPLFKLLEAAFQLLVPIVMASVVDSGIATGNRGHVLVCAVALVVMGVVGWVCAATAQYFSAKLGAGFGTALRDDLFRHVMSLSRADVDRLGPSTLVTRLTNDSNQVQDGVNLFFRLVLRCPIAVFGALAAAFVVDGWEGVVFTFVTALVLLLVWAVMRVAVRRYRVVQAGLDGILLRVSEQLQGVRVLRAFGREKDECASFDAATDRLRSLQVAVGDVSGLMTPLTYVAVNLGLVAVLHVGGIRVGAGGLTQGGVVALVNYMSQMLVELLKFANLVVVLSKAEACARRVNDVFAISPAMEDGTDAGEGLAGSLEFRDVSFTYPGASTPSLSHVSFACSPGAVLGVIGGTGSGKSTLAALAMRFYDATSGEVLVGGKDVRGQVDIDDVSFSYVPDRPLIEGFTLHARPGERVAIVGPTGCGKTTLINLLMRFYDVDGGSICVDGHDVREVTRASLRKSWGMVLQETWVKSASVRDNIALGRPDATDEEVRAVARAAFADEFIEGLPEGYDTVLGGEDSSISAGQRQLLCIARAMLANAPMLILDEATSNIDTRTEVKVQAAFERLMRGRTSFVVAHRLSTVRDADKIVAMRDGHVVEVGAHEELLARDGFYASLYRSQFEA